MINYKFTSSFFTLSLAITILIIIGLKFIIRTRVERKITNDHYYVINFNKIKIAFTPAPTYDERLGN